MIFVCFFPILPLDSVTVMVYTTDIEIHKTNTGETNMNKKQATGMMNFHKRAYKAYKAAGNETNAHQARAKMIELYLVIRAIRATA